MPGIGSRVSLRYRIPDSLTDVVGHLEALDPVVVVRTKSGDTVEIDPADVVSVRELSHAPVRNSEIRALEHAAALAWPGTEQHWHDGWLLRAGGSHTSRANSAVPLLFSANSEALSAIIAWYAERNLEPWLALPERLLPIKASGIRATRVLVRDVPTAIRPSGVTFAPDLSPVASLAPDLSPVASLAPVPDDHWLQIYARDVPVDVLTAVVDGVVTFATVPGAAVGRGAVTSAPDGTRWVGMSAVRVLENRRRHGHARALCAALLAWAGSQGATRAYVQVLEDNLPAITLYESLGFRLHHKARYVRASDLL
jgi:GNAT superfamily N-acetyltransferase